MKGKTLLICPKHIKSNNFVYFWLFVLKKRKTIFKRSNHAWKIKFVQKFAQPTNERAKEKQTNHFVVSCWHASSKISPSSERWEDQRVELREKGEQAEQAKPSIASSSSSSLGLSCHEYKSQFQKKTETTREDNNRRLNKEGPTLDK